MRDGKLLVELGAVVRGDVQGVGFRATAKFLARDLQLTGFARNLPDGSVEICAQGERGNLEELIVRLGREFSTASFETIYRQVGQKHSDFTIF